MAFEFGGKTISLKSSGDNSSNQFKAVTLSGSGNVILSTTELRLWFHCIDIIGKRVRLPVIDTEGVDQFATKITRSFEFQAGQFSNNAFKKNSIIKIATGAGNISHAPCGFSNLKGKGKLAA